MLKDKIKELESEIAELQARMPAHSIPNHMMRRLMELEDDLEEALEQLKKG
jgi:DNA-binding HxlR family transcriptional regulator